MMSGFCTVAFDFLSLWAAERRNTVQSLVLLKRGFPNQHDFSPRSVFLTGARLNSGLLFQSFVR